MIIRKYNKDADESKIMQMIREEEGWDYANPDMAEKYRLALGNSVTYVAIKDDELCGYSRSLDDSGFYLYVCDLLVKPVFRGQHLGKKLMESLYNDFPDHVIYVMSGVDGYYEKIGYKREGSIYEVPNSFGKAPFIF